MSGFQVTSFRMPFGLKVALFILLAVGGLSLQMNFTESSTRGWYSYLIGTAMFLGFGLFGLFFTAIQYITKARWSVNIRRIMEAMAMTLPIAALLGIGIYVGAHHIYEWSHAEKVATDPLLQWKSGFLNTAFFGKRLVIYFAIWLIGMFVLVRNSFKQDSDGSVARTLTNRRHAAWVLVAFGLSVSMAGFDILMSLEPHWFSTMFGVHYFAAFFQAGLALMVILAWLAYRSGTLKNFINLDHFYEMGKFVYGFSIFWGYIAFCEFMLIWYANLPEETFFYIERFKTGWACIAIFVLVLRLFVPMLVILPYNNKRNFKFLIPTCLIILAAHWLELYWIITPAMRLPLGVEMVPAMISWTDVGVGLGFLALFTLCAGMIMERIKLIPVGDPYVEASAHHHV